MRFSPVFLCLVNLCWTKASLNSEPPVTSVTQGRLEGQWFVTRGGRNVSGFLGIPYALPPVGSLRFESPQSPRPWLGVYSANQDKPSCPQTVGSVKVPVRGTVISEDCLYLNVFTPDVKANQKLPVLVFIPGGGFETATISSDVYGPEYLLDEDVILVVVSSRLGLLGFLSLDHPVLPGNLGLKDQRAALRWVNANIAQFGGDPRRVTISGESTGAASVQYHLIFSSHEGLARAGICEGGSARGLHVFQPGSQRSLVARLVEITGCPSDPVLLVECLRQLSVSKLLEIQEALKVTSSNIKRRAPLFRPVVEPASTEDALITNDPWETTLNSPLLQGANENDGLLFTVEFEKDKSNEKLLELNDNYRDILPYNLFFDETAENPEEIADTLKKFYFGNENIDRGHYLNLSYMFSDSRINYPLIASTRFNRGKTYVYQLNYKGANTLVHYLGSQSYYGVSHADELFFLFPLSKTRNVTQEDTDFSKKMVKLRTNFVKYLDPTPAGSPFRWKPSTSPYVDYLNFGQTNISMETGFLKRRMEFWTNLPYRNKICKGGALSLRGMTTYSPYYLLLATLLQNYIYYV